MHALLIISGLAMSAAGLGAAAMATSDPLRTRGWLIVLSAVLVACGAAGILFGIAGLVERFA